MPWQKGKSGNPGGRPKMVAEIRDLARSHTAEALDTLAAIMVDPKAPPAARVAAANSLLDRGWGKPGQAMDLTVTPRSFDEMSDEELMAIIDGRG